MAVEFSSDRCGNSIFIKVVMEDNPDALVKECWNQGVLKFYFQNSDITLRQ